MFSVSHKSNFRIMNLAKKMMNDMLKWEKLERDWVEGI